MSTKRRRSTVSRERVSADEASTHGPVGDRSHATPAIRRLRSDAPRCEYSVTDTGAEMWACGDPRLPEGTEL